MILPSACGCSGAVIPSETRDLANGVADTQAERLINQFL
jgi:hypothetical protein